jgi:hypothetical protein
VQSALLNPTSVGRAPNAKLLREFGVPLRKTAREAFQTFAEAQGLWRGA